MARIPRTSAENPYCANQKATDAPAERVFDLGPGFRKGTCTTCRRFVNVRVNGTPKLHKVYGRSEAQRNAHAAKRDDAKWRS